jgi:periplasmic divalent cation tolerance protein
VAGRPHARVALITAPSEEVAERLVRALLDEGLIACGNILPAMTSLYWWAGEVVREAEVLVVAKTTAEAAPRLIARVPELHPYELPEVLVLAVEAGHAPYLGWIAASMREITEKGSE